MVYAHYNVIVTSDVIHINVQLKGYWHQTKPVRLVDRGCMDNFIRAWVSTLLVVVIYSLNIGYQIRSPSSYIISQLVRWPQLVFAFSNKA